MAGATLEPSSHWVEVVRKIRSGDKSGAEDLYQALIECARARLFQNVDPQSVEDHLHEIMVVVLLAIRRGELRDPECVMGFVRTVTRRRVSAHIRASMVRRRRLVSVGSADEPSTPSHESPEARVLMRQQVREMKRALDQLCARDREILIRFYYLEQSPERICREMNLTATQFRLYKSRAIGKCSELTRSEMPALRQWKEFQSTRPLRIA